MPSSKNVFAARPGGPPLVADCLSGMTGQPGTMRSANMKFPVGKIKHACVTWNLDNVHFTAKQSPTSPSDPRKNTHLLELHKAEWRAPSNKKP